MKYSNEDAIASTRRTMLPDKDKSPESNIERFGFNELSHLEKTKD